MRFFVPAATDHKQAEEVYGKIRNFVATSIGDITDRRIYRLKYEMEGQSQTATVGSDRHSFGNQPVVAIFEGSNGVHYVCTQKNGYSEADPHPIERGWIKDAEDFSASA